ncbi:MAG: diguanylate cyclase, partial [Bacteroidia bacterium]
NGAGAIVLKSIFQEEILFEYKQWMAEAEKMGYDQENTDYFDLKIKEHNIREYINLIKEAKSTVDIPVIASINCISSYEWLDFTKKIEQAGADALELNIFYFPNSLSSNSAEIEDEYLQIIKKVKESISIPLVIKMSHYFTNLGVMIQRIDELGVDGIVLFNKFTQPDIDIKAQEVVVSNVFSSVHDFALPLRWVGVASGHTNCSLAASTGVHSGEELVKILLAGADAAQVVSTLYQNGPEQIKKMNDFLVDYLKAKNLSAVSHIKGLLSNKNIKQDNMYERVQFMKYFSGRD